MEDRVQAVIQEKRKEQTSSSDIFENVTDVLGDCLTVGIEMPGIVLAKTGDVIGDVLSNLGDIG